MFLFRESPARENLFPITLTRPVADIRVGILTIREKWGLSGLPAIPEAIDPAIIPNASLFRAIASFGYEDAINQKDLCQRLEFPWQIPALAAKAIGDDLELLEGSIAPTILPEHVKVTGNRENVIIEEAAQLEHCYINTTQGPVHIGKGAIVMEGAMLRGPVSIGSGTVVKMGAAIYGSAIGPNCIIGGEIKGSQFLGNSNKAHEGYIGDALIGEWCNLGAGTSCSNLRNNAGPVKAWHMKSGTYVPAGMKCGLIMGDHSKCSINTSFNTGTVVGVCANIFQAGQLTPKFIPSFSWGTDGSENYILEKAISDIRHWMAFKGTELSSEQIKTLTDIYNSQL